MKPSKLFCFKDTRRYYFFLAAGIKISQRANATALRVWCKWIHPTIGWRRDEQGTHKHTHGSWILFYITCSLVNNAFSVLHYVIKGFILLGTFAHGFAGCRLAASRFVAPRLLVGNYVQLLKVVFKMSIRIQFIFITTTGHTFPAKNCCSFFLKQNYVHWTDLWHMSAGRILFLWSFYSSVQALLEFTIN